MTTPTPITGDVTVDVKTTLGDITLKLYALTPDTATTLSKT